MRRFSLQFMQAVLLLVLAPVSCLAEQALIAVASNFSAPARAIVNAFELELATPCGCLRAHRANYMHRLSTVRRSIYFFRRIPKNPRY